jgi:hypothetical protein
MENPIHINIFDFDETLFRVPGYTCSEAKEMSPYEWFDSPESLSQKFNICGIENTLERTKDGCVNVLITHRVKQCQPRVLEILAENQISFDETFFLGRETSKGLTALKLIKEYEPSSITIFEDSLWEIIQYTGMFIIAGLSINIDFIFVDKSKVIKLDWETAKTIHDSQQSERLRLI